MGRIDALAARVEEAKRLRGEATKATTAVIKSARRRLIGSEPQADWVQLAHFVEEIENGWSPACELRQRVGDEWGVLKVGAVSFGKFNALDHKTLPANLTPRPEYEVKAGDFLMSRANASELVGACAVVKSTPSRLMLSDKHFRFRFRDGVEVDRDYLDQVLKSPPIRDQIIRGATGTSSTMKNISKDKVLRLIIPFHTMAEQRSIKLKLRRLQDQVSQAEERQSTTALELAALLPAILDRAFRGDL